MEGHERKEDEVDIERALERVDSSEEARDLEEGEAAFVDKWGNDPDLKDWIASYAENKEKLETRAVLQACIAAGGAGLAMFGIHDDLAQYMSEDTFLLADQVTSRIAGVATMLMAALASWENFRDSFKIGEKINRLRNQEA
jgi:hypothetical protein